MKIDQYRKIAQTLEHDVCSGKYEIGEAFPQRRKLAERFGVSLVTINRAVDQLIEDGLLVAVRGSGTIVMKQHKLKKLAHVCHEWCLRYTPRNTGDMIQVITYDDVQAQDDFRGLSKYDGIIWSHPPQELRQRIEVLCTQMPGIVINRAYPSCSYVGSDLSTPVHDYTLKLLEANPEHLVYYLTTQGENDPYFHGIRLDGVQSACREAKRYMEVLELPEEFAGKREVLQRSIDFSQPVILVPDITFHFGAVVAIVNELKLQWRKDIFYFDIDNQHPEHIWGVKVTTFQQDFNALHQTAYDKLIELIHHPDQVVQELYPVTFVDGET